MSIAMRGLIASAALSCALVLAACQAVKPPEGAVSVDAVSAASFYDPPPDAPLRPGVLLRSEPLRGVSLPPGVQGWRILYTTTIDDRTPATGSAAVFGPARMPEGARPVVSFTHGTTGLLRRCMPSLYDEPARDIPAMEEMAKAGWVVVATDYQFAEWDGPHPYMIGEGEARAALDAMRAARQMSGLDLEDRTVVWGHSQGGHSALWTGIVAPRYAPEIEILGVAGLAPVADLRKVVEVNSELEKWLGAYVAGAYSRFYPDVTVEQAVRPRALAAVRDLIKLCLTDADEYPRMMALADGIQGSVLALDTDAALAARVDENAIASDIPAPVLIAQGLADAIVLPAATEDFVARRCAAGQAIELWTFEGVNHESILRPGSVVDPLMAWTQARFAGEPAAQQCVRREY